MILTRWSLDLRRSILRNYALLRKRATEAPGDALYFSAWQQSSTRLKLRLPYPLGRVQNASTTKFFFSFTGYANIDAFPTYFVTDEGPDPKRLEKNSNQNTALLFIILLFFR